MISVLTKLFVRALSLGAADAYPGHILRGVVARGWDWTDELGMALLGAFRGVGPAQTRAGNLTLKSTEPQGAIIHRMDSAIP
ncbi:hypothetical protein B0H10DRAFT_2043693 [Mycena sp. CBHHK59/15]|nr:hypothetical protein B0H10DRAFT_2043693 [Mycena sp. CBHHK59/15]